VSERTGGLHDASNHPVGRGKHGEEDDRQREEHGERDHRGDHEGLAHQKKSRKATNGRATYTVARPDFLYFPRD